MAASGDVWRLICKGTFLAQQIINVYHYRQEAVGAGPSFAQDLINAFETTVIPAIQAVCSTSYGIESLEVRNLNSLTEFAVEDFVPAYAGDEGGDPSPSFVTWNYEYPLPSKAIRAGRKAIGGISEGTINGNEPTLAITPALIDLATALDLNMVENGSIWQPCVARIPSPEVTPYVPLSLVPTVVTFNGIGSQNSRKKGKGA